jgi:hypothetical protein
LNRCEMQDDAFIDFPSFFVEIGGTGSTTETQKRIDKWTNS